MKNLMLTLLLLGNFTAFAGGETGGGDEVITAFNGNVLTVTKWLDANGKSLRPHVKARDFFLAADPDRIVPINDKSGVHDSKFGAVTKQCDGRTPSCPSDLRTACYDSVTNMIYVSESRYPTTPSPATLGVTAHEVFRKMGLETDGYEVSRQIDVVSVPGASIGSDSLNALVGKLVSIPEVTWDTFDGNSTLTGGPVFHNGVRIHTGDLQDGTPFCVMEKTLVDNSDPYTLPAHTSYIADAQETFYANGNPAAVVTRFTSANYLKISCSRNGNPFLNRHYDADEVLTLLSSQAAVVEVR